VWGRDRGAVGGGLLGPTKNNAPKFRMPLRYSLDRMNNSTTTAHVQLLRAYEDICELIGILATQRELQGRKEERAVGLPVECRCAPAGFREYVEALPAEEQLNSRMA